MDKAFETDDEVMAKINGYAVTPLVAEQVYCFTVILCDNEIDRDFEKFSRNSLDAMAGLFLGKTGIFDHDPKGEKQSARLFDVEVKSYPDRFTRDGEVYCALTGKAYMVRTEENRGLIAEIDGGIKKEVSVSCSVAKRICSICGRDNSAKPCVHVKGESYGEKLCFHVLQEPTDAYEWSFVAVPAQVNAGVTKVKRTAEGGFSSQDFAQQAGKLAAACEFIRGEILSLSYFTKPFRSAKSISKLTESMDLYQLLDLRKALFSEVKKSEKQLAEEEESFITQPTQEVSEENQEFAI